MAKGETISNRFMLKFMRLLHSFYSFVGFDGKLFVLFKEMKFDKNNDGEIPSVTPLLFSAAEIYMLIRGNNQNKYLHTFFCMQLLMILISQEQNIFCYFKFLAN